MFDHQEYNEAENLKESDDGSPESRRSTRKILAQLIKKVDELTVEVRSSKKEAAPSSGTIHRNESNDNLTRDLLLQCTSVTEITDKLSITICLRKEDQIQTSQIYYFSNQ